MPTASPRVVRAPRGPRSTLRARHALPALLTEDLGTDYFRKEAFRRAARAALSDLAAALALPKGSYSITWNASGSDSSGDATLHSERVYVSVEQRLCALPPVLYRTVRHRKDYQGGQNHFTSAEALVDTDAFAATIRALVGDGPR